MNSYWKTIPGWFDFMIFYDALVETAQPGDILVELGVYLGRSLCYLGTRAAEANKQLQVYGVDSYPAYDFPGEMKDMLTQHPEGLYSVCLHHVAKAGLLNTTHLLHLDGDAAANLFEDKSVFAVFVDTSHRYEPTLAEIKAWLPKIRPGGVIAGHDTDQPGVMRAVTELLPDSHVSGIWSHRVV